MKITSECQGTTSVVPQRVHKMTGLWPLRECRPYSKGLFSESPEGQIGRLP